ncbi:MAG: ATP-binding protein [Oscillospiraceae bacterium]|nr:ATP-binding protein [Oscillospiraceae bacterium]
MEFNRWGLHLFVGKFGAGKTCTMVHYAYQLAKQYKSLSIVTNLQLKHFPKRTNILPLRTAQDILNAPDNTLVLIDEIGTIFNSRDFSSGKNSIPKFLFQHLCQCRKRHIMIYGTTQRWNFLDKQLRDITDTVYVTRSWFPHPFTRMCTVRRYDALEYDAAYSNPLLPLTLLAGSVYVQTDKLRRLYSTDELIENMLDKSPDEYLTDDEVMKNRGELDVNVQEIDRKSRKSYKKKRRAF